jgi:hypothetical protein
MNNFSTISNQPCVTYFNGGVYLMKCRFISGPFVRNAFIYAALYYRFKRRMTHNQECYAYACEGCKLQTNMISIREPWHA